MSTITQINTKEFNEKVRTAEGLVLVDFSATWCGPCKRMLPELEAAAAELGDKATVYKIDVDESPEIAMEYGVQGIPNLTFFSGGKVVDTAVGLMNKATIVGRIKQNLQVIEAGAPKKVS